MRSTSTSRALLEAADLGCERGGRRLFSALTLSLQGGEALRIAGANGSGKTSLLRILCGLLAPAQGEVRWKGEPIRRLAEEYSRCLAYIGHAAGLKDELSAAENLGFACALAGLPAQGVDEALGRFGIPPGQAVKQLSQGQRRRAALARLALSSTLPLWLLDEPWAALDREGGALLNALLQQHLERGGAVMFATHQDPGIAAARVVELG